MYNNKQLRTLFMIGTFENPSSVVHPAQYSSIRDLSRALYILWDDDVEYPPHARQRPSYTDPYADCIHMGFSSESSDKESFSFLSDANRLATFDN